MDSKNENIDMLHGNLAGSILRFAIPIALSSMLQQLFNAADTAVVGVFQDENALAAVGTNTEIVALIVTISAGLSVGANLLIANKIGEDKQEDLGRCIRIALILAGLIGIMGCILGQFLARPLLLWIQTPADILKAAVSYLRIYFLGFPFLILYDFEAAILRAFGNSKYPFLVLIASGVINVLMNLILVVACHMGVSGVAIATSVSTVFSAGMLWQRLRTEQFWSMYMGRHFWNRRCGALPLWLQIQSGWRDAAGMILKNGIPAAVQGAVFCIANIFVQSAVNTFGGTAIAGSTIAMNFEYFTYYIITAFGQAATTFTGQNHAAGQEKRCRQILSRSLLCGLICSSIPIFVIVFFRDFFSGMFSTEPAVIRAASVRVLCILLYEPLCNFYEIPAGYLRGKGWSLYPAIAAMTGTCVFRIAWILTVYQKNPTLPMLYHAFPFSWMLTIALVGMGLLLVRQRR